MNQTHLLKKSPQNILKYLLLKQASYFGHFIKIGDYDGNLHSFVHLPVKRRTDVCVPVVSHIAPHNIQIYYRILNY